MIYTDANKNMSRKLLLSIFIYFALQLCVYSTVYADAQGGSDSASGGGFPQLLAYIQDIHGKDRNANFPPSTVKQLCERFVEYGNDGLELLRLLMTSGMIAGFRDPAIGRDFNLYSNGDFEIKLRVGFAREGKYFIVSDKELLKIKSESKEICEKNLFEINFDLKDRKNQELAATNEPEGKIVVNPDKLTSLFLEEECKNKFSTLNPQTCPFFLLRSLASHELISRSNRKLERDGVYHLSSRIITRLGDLKIIDYKSNGHSKRILEGESELKDGMGPPYIPIQCLNQYSSKPTLDEYYNTKKFSQNEINTDLNERIKTAKKYISYIEEVSSLFDRAFDTHLDIGAGYRSMLINEIICLSQFKLQKKWYQF